MNIIKENMFQGKKTKNSLIHPAGESYSLSVRNGLSHRVDQFILSKKEIEKSLQEEIEVIREVYLPILALSLWDLDDDKIHANLENLMKMKYVNGIALESGQVKPIVKIKNPADFETITFNINYNTNGNLKKIGELTLHIDQDYVWNQVVASIFRIILSNLLLVAVISIAIYLLINKSLIRNIQLASSFLSRIHNEQIDQTTLDLQRKPRSYYDEIDLMVAVINNMKISLFKYTSNLQEIIVQKMHEIRGILDSIPIGVLSLENNTQVSADFSAHTVEILNDSQIAGRSFKSLFLDRSSLPEDVISRIESSLYASLGENEITFRFNAECLVEETKYTTPEGVAKIIEITWTPLIVKDSVDKVLVTLKDVTEIRNLQLNQKQKSAMSEAIDGILNCGENSYRSFSKSFDRLKAQILAILESAEPINIQQIRLLFIAYHTIKGNAQSCGLKRIAEQTHLAEEYIAKIRDNHEIMDKNFALNRMKNILQVKEQYDTIATKLKFQLTEEIDHITLTKTQMKTMLNDSPQQLKTRLTQLLAQHSGESLEHILQDPFHGMAGIATKLRKSLPSLELTNEANIMFIDGTKEWLAGVFNHLIRNSLDHGIEDPEIRIQRKKSPTPIISLVVTRQNSNIIMDYQDDGQGLNLERIRNKGKAKGFNVDNLSPSELANLILLDGFSTAERTTDISGRGVGINAVASLLNEQGGTLALILKEQHPGSEYVSVIFHLVLPDRHEHLAVVENGV